MRIVNVLEATVPLSRYADPATAPGDLDTSVVAVLTDVMRGGRPVVGLGYGSVGRYAQGGLIRARFAPRLLQAPDGACADASTGNLDPALAWRAMMAGEKPGGHGERCVAVGALDMAIWDAAAKIADEPLCRHIARRRAAWRAGPRAGVRGRRLSLSARRRGPAGGRGAGLRRAGVQPDQDQDRRRGPGRRSSPHRDGIGAAAHGRTPGGGRDERLRSRQRAGGGACCPAMACGGSRTSATRWISRRWRTWRPAIRRRSPPARPCSRCRRRLLARHGGLRPDRDVLVFDPAHCYGLTAYVRIVEEFLARGWPARAFWPHGGHLFGLHVAAGLGWAAPS